MRVTYTLYNIHTHTVYMCNTVSLYFEGNCCRLHFPQGFSDLSTAPNMHHLMAYSKADIYTSLSADKN